MYVYNNTRRLINPGGKLPLIPGENVITKEQAAYLSKFSLESYLKGKDPMLTISEEKIVEAVEDKSKVNEAERKLRDFVEDSGGAIMDATEGIPDEAEDDLAAKIAARVGGK
jgi:hypothetical protein